MKSFRRRRILVDNFQRRLLAVSLSYFGAILLVFAATLFMPLMMALQDDAVSWDQKQQASSQFLALHTRLWPAIAVLFVLLTLHTVIVSHRVAGPLFQFRRAFRSIAQGNLSLRVAIRKNDYLTKEAKDINDMIASLESRVQNCRSAVEMASASLEGLRAAVSSGDSAEALRLFGHLEVHVARALRDLEHFETRASKEDEPGTEDIPGSLLSSVPTSS
jgi:methyl-accepting chemotaxis protein